MLLNMVGNSGIILRTEIRVRENKFPRVLDLLRTGFRLPTGMTNGGVLARAYEIKH